MATILRRQLANGAARYDAQIRRGGVTRKRSHRTRAAAERWARKIESEIDDRREVPTAAESRTTVAEVLDAYAAEALDRLAWAPTVRAYLGWWKTRIGSLLIRNVRREDVRQGLAALEAGQGISGQSVSGSTRRRYLAALRAALTWAESRELITVNVARGAARKGRDVEPPGRTRYLDDAERARLLEAVDAEQDQRLSALVRLALYTGMRQGELTGLRWSQVDLGRGLASLPRTKSGYPRSVALSRPAVELLTEVRRRRSLSPFVFGHPGMRMRSAPAFPRLAWDRAVAAAGLWDFRFHDLRHSFASYLLSAGATLPELAAALGHRSLQMVSRYAHLERAHAATLAERVAERIG